MTDLIFKLNGVPEDEAQDVRELLVDNEIAFYETTAGKWGTATAAIWLKDGSQRKRARELLEGYQNDRLRRVRAEYAALQDAGKTESMWARCRQKPVQFLFYLGIIAGIIYLSIFPFINFTG